MTSTYDNPADNGQQQGQPPRSNGRCCSWDNANWSVSNITAMVLGFIFFWPIGLFLLYWIFKGRRVQELPGEISAKWRQFKGFGYGRESGGDNTVFNDYQQTQYDRIREIKTEIKNRARRFADFRRDEKRRADEEEFQRFMKEAPSGDS